MVEYLDDEGDLKEAEVARRLTKFSKMSTKQEIASINNFVVRELLCQHIL